MNNLPPKLVIEDQEQEEAKVEFRRKRKGAAPLIPDSDRRRNKRPRTDQEAGDSHQETNPELLEPPPEPRKGKVPISIRIQIAERTQRKTTVEDNDGQIGANHKQNQALLSFKSVISASSNEKIRGSKVESLTSNPGVRSGNYKGRPNLDPVYSENIREQVETKIAVLSPED